MNDSVKDRLKCCCASLYSRFLFIVFLIYHIAGIFVQYEVQIPMIFYEVHIEQCGLGPSSPPNSIWFPPAARYSTINQYPHCMSHVVRYKISVMLYIITSVFFKSCVSVRVYRSKFILQMYTQLFQGSSYQIVLGANKWNLPGSGSLVLYATTSIVHELFDSNTFNNDIALIQLPITVAFSWEYCHILTNFKIVLLVL